MRIFSASYDTKWRLFKKYANNNSCSPLPQDVIKYNKTNLLMLKAGIVSLFLKFVFKLKKVKNGYTIMNNHFQVQNSHLK